MSIAVVAILVLSQSRAPEYVTSRVDRGDIDSTVTTTGNLNAVITVQVGSQVSGNIIALYADFNTKVKKGQLVAEIDPAPFKAAVEQETATLNAPKAAVVTAEANLAKSQSNLASAGERRQPEGERREDATRRGVGATRERSQKDSGRNGSTSREDADTAQANKIRNREIGFVFQQFNLLARTSAIENVELPLLYTTEPVPDLRARALQALASVGLAERADHHPNQLSGGQQQRVAIARALVNNPQIILADEPTGALDSRTSIEIMAIFQRLNRQQGITTIIVTHEPDIAAYANRNIYFRDGRIVRDEKIAHPQQADRELLHFSHLESVV